MSWDSEFIDNGMRHSGLLPTRENREVERLTRELQETEETRAYEESRANGAVEELRVALNDLDAARADIERLTRDLAAARAEIERLREALEEKKEANDEQRVTCDTAHDWQMDGARSCPYSNRLCNSSQPVFVCVRCGETDYGEPGGPGHAYCESECNREVDDE